MHPLLARQLSRVRGSIDPGTIAGLLSLIDEAYRAADEDRALVQRSLDVMSDELQRRHDELAARLRERERLERALREVHDAVLFLDDGGTIIAVNGATQWLTGRSVDRIVGQTLGELVVDSVDTGPPTDAASRGVRAGVSDVVLERPDGTRRSCELTLVPLDPEPDAKTSMLGLLRDVSERQAWNQHLLQSQKLEAIGQLAAGIAHEINTPAQYVADNLRFLEEAFAQLARVSAGESPGTDPAEIEYLREEVPRAIEQSLSGMDRIAEIVRGVKTLAHPGSAERVPCDVNGMLQSTVAVTRNEWKYVADVQLDLDPDLPQVSAYAGELHHVFLNLVVNAAQAIGSQARAEGERGVIGITSTHRGKEVEIRIRDSGPGVPPEIRERIFEPFFTTKPAGTGTGQGLTICRKALQHHGGSLTLECPSDGGAEFVVRLPTDALARQAA